MSPSPPTQSTQLTVFLSLSLSLHTWPYTSLQHILCSYATHLWWIVIASLSLKIWYYQKHSKTVMQNTFSNRVKLHWNTCMSRKSVFKQGWMVSHNGMKFSPELKQNFFDKYCSKGNNEQCTNKCLRQNVRYGQILLSQSKPDRAQCLQRREGRILLVFKIQCQWCFSL